MNIYINLITSIRALRRNKLRSSLSMIGIIIGISSVIAMVGLGKSAESVIDQKIKTYGVNAMSVELKENRSFSESDLVKIPQYVPQVRYITPMESIGEKDIKSIHKYRQNRLHAQTYFANEDYFNIQMRGVSSGRQITDSDVRSSAKVAVIGINTAEKLFGTEDPIGKIITIGDNSFTVIGILEKKGEALSGRDFDNMSVIPYTTGLKRFRNKPDFNEIHLATYSEYDTEEAKKQLTSYMIHRFSLSGKAKKSFIISTSQDKLQMAQDITLALSILLAGVASISLFVGGVGIMNIMLVSVTERTREIGIRMAIGARENDIMLQFLFESILLSSIGGAAGIILGIGLYFGITYKVQWPFSLSVISVVGPFLFSSAIGIFFGYYPSKKASRLKPIDALKYE